MSRLSRYLLVQYSKDSLALFVVAGVLVALIQMLRLFDLVTAKGQDLLTLVGQALLTTPPLAQQIVYICMAIGLARAFKALQESRELHSIHIMQRVSAIWSALAIFLIFGMLFSMVLAHWGTPVAQHATKQQQAQIAAELVGQTLVPGRFIEVSRDVVVYIGGRQVDGTIVDFFADDNRQPELRRTYFADAATIVKTDSGFQISLRNGRLQIYPADERYSEIEFARYELAIAELTESIDLGSSNSELPTWELLAKLRADPDGSKSISRLINQRFAEAPRVLAICLLVAALMAFPHARRGRKFLPIELLILMLGFAERFASNYLSDVVAYGSYSGPALIFGAALVLLAVRFRSFLRGAGVQRPAREVPA